MANTKQQGQFRFVIYKKSRDSYFTGVCLDLDIVEENKDPFTLRKSLEEAARGYLESVTENNLNDELLNKPAPKKYWKVVEDLEEYFHRLHQFSLSKEKPLPLKDSQVFTRSFNDLVRI